MFRLPSRPGRALNSTLARCSGYPVHARTKAILPRVRTPRVLFRMSTASVPGIRLRRTEYATVKTAQRIEDAGSFQDARPGAGTSNRRKAKDRPVRSPGRGSKPSLTASRTLNAHEPLFPTVNDVRVLRRAPIPDREDVVCASTRRRRHEGERY